MQNRIKTQISKCSGCGNNMLFDPNKQCLSCSFCDSSKEISSKLDLSKHDTSEGIAFDLKKDNNSNQQVHSMQCPNCGATAVLSEFQSSAVCPYCNTNLIACKEQSSSLKPNSIVPFKIGKEKAEQLFKEKLANKWFISSKFKKSINADEIKGYYFPSFLFDAIGSTTYSGRLYTEEKKEKEDGTTETIRNYFNISGTRETHHNNVEVEASSKLTQLELNFIKPYNLSEARAYSNEFIYGFSLEQHDTNLDKALLQAQNLMKFDIRNTILNSYDHDGVSNLDLRTSFYNQKYNYCMLPIYRINFSYKNKTYTNVMNGQTGSLGGDYPKSAGKISLVVILSILGFLLPIILFVLVAVLGIL